MLKITGKPRKSYLVNMIHGKLNKVINHQIEVLGGGVIRKTKGQGGGDPVTVGIGNKSVNPVGENGEGDLEVKIIREIAPEAHLKNKANYPERTKVNH